MQPHYTSISDALEVLLGKANLHPRVERLRPQQAFSRVLAEDVIADLDIPPHDASHMDGYAVRSSDLAAARPDEPVRLRLRGQVPLGAYADLELGPGEAVRVPTGGYIPRGADAVVPVEEALLEGEEVVVRAPVPKGAHIYARGATISRGALALRKGRLLTPQDIGLLLALGRATVSVYARPRAVVIPIGSELADVPEEGKIPNSHGPLVAGLLEGAGCEVELLNVVPDEPLEVKAVLKDALHRADLALTIAGSSVGEKDVTERALSELEGLELLVHGLRLDPGRRGGCALVGHKPIFLLPGLILGTVSVLITLALPVLQRLGSPGFPRIGARLAAEWRARRRYDFTKVVYLKLQEREGLLEALPLLGETEKLTVLTEANACMVVPEHVVELRRGTRVEALLLPGWPRGGEA